MKWAAAAITLFAAAAVLVVGVRKGTFAASDTDPYGYVSEADLIAHGALHIDRPIRLATSWPDAQSSFVPPGYTVVNGAIVPAYPPGLPLVMAAFERSSGRRTSVFYVVPLLGALAVWMTGWLGATVHSRLGGTIAAILVAASPSFLYQVTQPVSDVPSAAWWTTSLALSVGSGSWTALLAGLAASMAILTRPNLVPLAAVIGAWFVWSIVRADIACRRAAVWRLALFAAGVVPGCLAVAGVDAFLYGSPLRSGYGGLNELYGWSHVAANLDRYPRWLIQTQTPFICLALAAPWVARRGARSSTSSPLRTAHVWLLLGFAAVVFMSYLVYGTFGRNEWVYVRFLLPAYPPLVVLSVAVALDALRRFTARRKTYWLASIGLCAALAAREAHVAIDRGAFQIQDGERRYIDVGRYVAMAMPREAVFIAGLHSGSIRYYSDRLTINYNRLEPRYLNTAIEALEASGYYPYIALEEGEEASFRERFNPSGELSQLDWPPRLETFQMTTVRIWDPADRPRFLSGEAIFTSDILFVGKPTLKPR